MVEILEEGEAWVGDGDSAVTFVVVVYRDGSDLFKARIDKPVYSNGTLDLSRVSGVTIPIDDVYPHVQDGLTVLRCVPAMCYRKKHSLLRYEPEMENNLAQLVLQEARIGEVLRRNQHPNVAQYLGCQVDESNRVVALCWQRYKDTLTDRMRFPVERRVALQWLEEIRTGILHLHYLGLCHNDLNPSNVMITKDSTAVIIDFDSCRPQAEPLGDKSGTESWADNSAKLSQPSNDLFSFELVKDFVLKNLKLHRPNVIQKSVFDVSQHAAMPIAVRGSWMGNAK